MVILIGSSQDYANITAVSSPTKTVVNSSHLVVEQTGALFDEDDTKLLGRLKDGAVVLATAGGSDVLGTRTSCTEHVVDEGELFDSASVQATKTRNRVVKSLTKASDETATSPILDSQLSRSSWVKGAGTSSKTRSYSAFSTSLRGVCPEQRRSIALLLSARLVPAFHLMFSTRSWKRIHQLSALSPAKRVQWIRLC